MSVGLVVVSHSALIAAGTRELAAQMAPGVCIEPAGGTDEGEIGTSFEKIQAALAAAQSGDGVVLLCDLGSAVMTAETVMEFMDDDERARVRLADAPIVEGTVAAAVAAEAGEGLDAVLAAAQSAAGDDGEAAAGDTSERTAERTLRLVNPSGLHARPAAELVKLAGTFDAAVTVNGVDAKSLLRIMALGLAQGAEVTIAADGADAEAALDALSDLVESGFGE